MQLTGTGVGGGIAIGPVVRMEDPLPEPVDHPSERTPDIEAGRAADALSATAADLAERGRTAGGAAKEVLEAQALMAADPTLATEVANRVQGGATAERAVFDAFAGYRDTLAAMGGYLAERAADLDDISQRVRAHLAGVPAPGVPAPGHPFVLVARDLSPADTATLDLDQVRALVTAEGGPTSHTAILAREKSIVAIVGVRDASTLADGEVVIVDAGADTVTVAPTPAQLADAERRIADRATLAAAPLEPGRLADGTPVPLLANLGSADGAAEAVRLGAEGVGLFRTEFLFLDADRAPTVEEQRVEYVRLLEAFPGRKVVVRVLDAGADKPLSFVNDDVEPNPALGLRGIRALRAAEPVLRDQLTALAQADAATDAELQVMAPMVATVEEARYFTELAKELGVAVAGVMVETPSAALIADRVLAVTDFASIGTNDLAQYTMAADRLLGSVAALQDPWHPAVLRLIGEVGAAGAKTGRPVGVCGEAAADPLLAVVLVGLGVTSLSMSPSAIAEVRSSLLGFARADAERFARAALATDGASEARGAVREAVAAMRGDSDAGSLNRGG
ncbi:phosphoenolpyruvate--protein phosphotransferase [Agromyces sp. Leaf222]|uniref:phosphoenolpyruvate--protein phosphotransferase n=1 Tax=Agromyces sp. Leaf222 TaxID=1735688 RepID=UPI0006F57579|nr:phosphoenolpyruvate--protein phosphotransferase [Agromyces sp. Leaf222]KQM84276.1 phosphoenolpyruvate-protein phosphotransferase [Agromyces sp. Leaf222]